MSSTIENSIFSFTEVAVSLKIPEIKWHSFSNKPRAIRNKMPVEQENNIVYFISELETETKKVLI